MMEDLRETRDVRERLDLIEAMVLEGRRVTERWGWAFVLWGVAYYVAIVWTATARFGWAWPITVIAAILIEEAIRRSRGSSKGRTTLARSIGAVWIAFGVSIFLLLTALSLSQRLTDAHVVFAILAAMLGLANGASAMIVRWGPQMACAVVWWATAVACCYEGSMMFETPWAFLVAVFLCQIVFGVYCMYLDGRKPSVAAQGMGSHA